MERSRLRIAIFAAGLTVTQVAQQIGVSRESVYSWCRGKFKPDAERRERLARLLGASERWLFGEVGS